MTRLREAKKRQDEEIARVQEFIDRFRYKATKAAQVQSRIKMLEKIERIEVPPERKRIHFHFPAAPKSGRTVLDVRAADKSYGDKHVLAGVDLLIERGDRIALVGHNGAGKSTLMRLLSGEEPPDRGERREGHQVVMQYFAQDEATRLDPALTVYETLSSGSPDTMIPAIRNILGGFLFSGDDVYKKASVLSGGERTRLAVARMLLRSSNTLLLDEPTNHLDLDSKEVLLDALVDYGGTLVFVSHDRYFVERLATKIVEVGDGKVLVYPGTYPEFLWSKENKGAPGAVAAPDATRPAPAAARTANAAQSAGAKPHRPGPAVVASSANPRAENRPTQSYEERKRDIAERRKREKAFKSLRDRIDDLESRIAARETRIKELEQAMATPGFYDDHTKAKSTVDEHQSLMWEVGDLLGQWEMLQSEVTAFADLQT
jgi:ATP-binding cassette subfamily F protein 3